MKYLLKSYLTPKSKFHQGVFVMMNSILTRAVFFILLGMLGIVVYQTLCKNDDINSREERHYYTFSSHLPPHHLPRQITPQFWKKTFLWSS